MGKCPRNYKTVLLTSLFPHPLNFKIQNAVNQFKPVVFYINMCTCTNSPDCNFTNVLQH